MAVSRGTDRVSGPVKNLIYRGLKLDEANPVEMPPLPFFNAETGTSVLGLVQ